MFTLLSLIVIVQDKIFTKYFLLFYSEYCQLFHLLIFFCVFSFQICPFISFLTSNHSCRDVPPQGLPCLAHDLSPLEPLPSCCPWMSIPHELGWWIQSVPVFLSLVWDSHFSKSTSLSNFLRNSMWEVSLTKM